MLAKMEIDSHFSANVRIISADKSPHACKEHISYF
jgi:hypothetical protein